MDKNTYDFSGYATRNDLVCGDGRTIRKNAFKDCDGTTVPLIWNHDHTNQDAVLGHALLENRDDGVYAYCTCNDTEQGKLAKQLIQHGDVRSLSIYANKLKQIGNDVIHGAIRELSLVLSGANPGAYIDYVLAHGEDEEDSLIANYDETTFVLYHSDEKKEEKKVAEETKKPETKESEKDEGEETVADVFNTLNEKQKTVVYAMIGQALEDAGVTDDDDDDDEESEGGKDMKHNVFENDKDTKQGGVLSHSDEIDILNLAKSSNVGSFKAALEIYADNNALQHDAVSGFTQNTETEGNITTLFPEYHDVKPGAPELLTNDQGWISTVMAKVHKSPFSRIRTGQVDIRNIDALRAKGYKKGTKKEIVGNYNLARRTTDPQTVFVKSALHRDDIIDITDFDIVQYQYNIDRMSMNEELATAFLIGDGREVGAEGKIEEDKIRPIWKDDELYTLHYDLDLAKARTELQGTNTSANFGENYIAAEAMINTVLYAREKFKGTGTPDMYITPHMLNVMLLARDINGRRIYSSRAELETALNVAKIHTVEQFEGKTRTTSDSKTKKLVALIVNLADYSVGATKGGEVTHFTQFDIDFNQQKSLLETRCSGALTKVYSAIAIEEDVTASAGAGTEEVAG